MKTYDYEALSIGDEFSSKFTITEQFVKGYVEAVGETYEAGKVPNYVFSVFTPIYDALGGRNSPGAIQFKQKTEHFSSASVGDELDVVVTITNKYHKKNKDYLVYEVEFLKENTLICKQETVTLWHKES